MLCCFPRYVALIGITLATTALLSPEAPAGEASEKSQQGQKPTPSSKTNSPPATPQQSSQVAVVDIDRLLKENRRFRAAIEDLKKQRESDQAELQKDADNIVRLERQLQQHEQESEKYQQLEETIAVAETALVAKRLELADDQERHEARIYFAFHHEVTTEIRHFAQRFQINLVVPYDSSEVSVEDSAEEILRKMKNGPLYHNKIDITDDLMRRIQPGRSCCLRPSVQAPVTQR